MARGRPDMTAAGEGALLTGRDVIALVVNRVVDARSADTSGVVFGGVVVVAGSSGSPTHGGKKSKA